MDVKSSLISKLQDQESVTIEVLRFQDGNSNILDSKTLRFWAMFPASTQNV